MISERITGEPKDFAFVEYFTIEEATIALNQIKRIPVKIRGNPLFVTFSKIKRPDEKVKLILNLKLILKYFLN